MTMDTNRSVLLEELKESKELFCKLTVKNGYTGKTHYQVFKNDGFASHYDYVQKSYDDNLKLKTAEIFISYFEFADEFIFN